MTTRLPPGMTIKSLKSHPSLIPLWVSIGGGALLAGAYLTRLATRNPDVCWDRKNNPYPWQKTTQNHQIKFYAVKLDFKNNKFPQERPEI